MPYKEKDNPDMSYPEKENRGDIFCNFAPFEDSKENPVYEQISFFDYENNNIPQPKYHIVADDGSNLTIPKSELYNFYETRYKERIKKYIGFKFTFKNEKSITLLNKKINLNDGENEIKIPYNDIYDIIIIPAKIFSEGIFKIKLNDTYLDKISSVRPVIEDREDENHKRLSYEFPITFMQNKKVREFKDILKYICNEIYILYTL